MLTKIFLSFLTFLGNSFGINWLTDLENAKTEPPVEQHEDAPDPIIPPQPTDHGGTDGGATDHGGTDHGDTDHGGTDHGGTDGGGMDHGGTDHGDTDGGGMDGHEAPPALPLPTTAAEADLYVAILKAMPETHAHGDSAMKAGEHMAALDLVARDDATHVAIGNGSWFDPANWHNGEIPGDGAKVLIPDGVHMVYDAVDDTRLFTVRADGHLEFAHDVDSQMIVDTMVVTPTGELTIGTVENPVHADVDVDIIFANNGPIDVAWDPQLLSRGLIAHGETNIHGAVKDSHEKVIDDPMAGETWVDMGTLPEGWEIGDTIVIAGTHYDGHWATGEFVHEDEVRVITDIEGGRLHFDDPLIFDHDAPRDDLHTSVANYSRNVSFETENADTAEIFERGHVMFMHSDQVDVRYAEFNELGRTDKSQEALSADEVAAIEFDTNVKARYSFHLHKTGADGDPAIVEGNAVFGSPGWGFVHHDSNALLENNATYDTFGAGYVAESGNETGAWTDNIAIFAEGNSWSTPKNGNDLANFDLGQTGDGFWFQGRMVAAMDNIAASVNHGFVYFHRGAEGEDANILFDGSLTNIDGVFNHNTMVHADEVPILSFSNNEAFAAREGLHVVKADPNQGHDIHSVIDGFTAWSVVNGAHFEYTSHYILEDFDVIGRLGGNGNPLGAGIEFGNAVSDFTIISPTIENFKIGIDLFKNADFVDPAVVRFVVIDHDISGVETALANYDPALDTLHTAGGYVGGTPDIQLSGTLTFHEGNPHVDPDARYVEISGVKTDSLGETPFPSGSDDYGLGFADVLRILSNDGYYTTSAGDNFFYADLYFSDRLTGEVFVETHPVMLDSNVTVGMSGTYKDAVFNGVQDLGQVGDLSNDDATLWATLTDGQIDLSEQAKAAIAAEEAEDALEAAF